MKNKKIIITGGSGGIGKQLANRLVADGYREVVVLDRTIKPGLDVRVRAIEIDLTDEVKSKPYFEIADYIVHLACIKPSERGTINEEYLKNLKMTMNVAQFNKKAKVIYASAGTIYGSCDVFPIKEEEEITCKLEDFYCRGKLESEQILQEHSNVKKWPLVILRITNIYGNEFRRRGEILANFFEKITSNTELKITGFGKQKRDRIHVDDVIDSIILSLDDNIKGIFNIGSGESHSTLEVAELMGKILKKNYTVEFEDDFLPKKIEREDNLLDITKAKDILGFNPKIEFKKGLELVINNWSKKYEIS